MNPTTNQVTDTVHAFLKSVQNGAFIGSHHFQETIYDSLRKSLVPLGFYDMGISPKHPSPRERKERRQLIQYNRDNNIPMLVYEINGSQATPDTSIIFNKNEIELEDKATQNGTIMWNSGLPEENVIYIIVKTKSHDVTFGMGQDMITSVHRRMLRSEHQQHLEEGKKRDARLKNDKCAIGYYTRAMYQDTRKWFDDNLVNTPIPNRKDREENVFRYIRSLH